MPEIVYWNVARPPRLLRRLPYTNHLARLENNFGDLLGPMVVGRLLEVNHYRNMSPTRPLLTVGSIIHMATMGSVVWGSGRNGNSDSLLSTALDIRAVRGPLTRNWLLSKGVKCPVIYGDPALLLPELRPDLVEASRVKRHDVTFVRHIDQKPQLPIRKVRTISARDELEKVLRTIVQSKFVVASSLHAIIVAEAFGIPARTVRSPTESPFKYEDYYQGTGRRNYRIALNLREAVKAGGEEDLIFDREPLVEAFPFDLFESCPDR